jgi:hypothetical protein
VLGSQPWLVEGDISEALASHPQRETGVSRESANVSEGNAFCYRFASTA